MHDSVVFFLQNFGPFLASQNSTKSRFFRLSVLNALWGFNMVYTEDMNTKIYHCTTYIELFNVVQVVTKDVEQTSVQGDMEQPQLTVDTFT